MGLFAHCTYSSMRTVCKCLKRNSDQLITLQIWMSRSYHVWRATHKAILNTSSEIQNSFWNKNRTGEDMGHFSVGPINKAVPSVTSSLTKVRKGWRKTFSRLLKKVFALMVFVLFCIVETFLITSQLLSCHDEKQRNFVISVVKVMKLSRLAEHWTVTSV